MTNAETVKRLQELIDEIVKPPDPKPTEPEWTLVIGYGDGCQVCFRGVNRTLCLSVPMAVTMVNALNSSKAMRAACKRVVAENPPVTTWGGDSLGEAATKALRLTTLYGDDGRLKDG